MRTRTISAARSASGRTSKIARLLGMAVMMIGAQVGLALSSGVQPAFALPTLSTPIGVVDPSGFLYIANSGNGTVGVYNETTRALVGSANVGTQPYGIDISNRSGNVYVANAGSNTVSVLDSTSYQVKFTIGSGGQAPHGVAVDQKRNRVGVTNSASNNVVFLDGGTGNLLASVNTPNAPEAIANDSALGQYYTANSAGQSVSVISAQGLNVTTTVQLPGWLPQAIAADPASHRVFVAAASAVAPTTNAGELFVLDGANILGANPLVASASTGIGVNPRGVAFANGHVLVTNFGNPDGTPTGDHSFSVLTYTDGSYTTLASNRRVPGPYRPFGATYSPSVGDFFTVNQDNTGDPGSISQMHQNGDSVYTGGDNTPPKVTFNQPTNPTITGTVSDNAAGVAVDSATPPGVAVTYTSTTDGSTTNVTATTSCADTSRLSCTWTASEPTATGQYSVSATATDQVGNSGTYTSQYQVYIIGGAVAGTTAGPGLPCLTSPVPAVLIKGTGQLCGTASAGVGSITLTYTPTDSALNTTYIQSCGSSCVVGGTWSITTTAPTGNYTVTATATDVNGGAPVALSGSVSVQILAAPIS
ncbi:MAG: hypothetical protein ABR573_01195 [Candidatus Dormibacteria bacterium]